MNGWRKILCLHFLPSVRRLECVKRKGENKKFLKIIFFCVVLLMSIDFKAVKVKKLTDESISIEIHCEKLNIFFVDVLLLSVYFIRAFFLFALSLSYEWMILPTKTKQSEKLLSMR